MARPRIFVSSTYYDLKHIRASLDLFIDSLGFEPVLSEKGHIAYTHDRPLDESCYREVENAEIFVLVIGGRYGSEVSGDRRRVSQTFFERYDSITRREYESAAARDIPIYILVEKGVHSEYQTFLRNKGVENISCAHVDSVNVFVLIEDILSRPRNNPVHTFEKFEDIENWLREQWSGMFRELLNRQSQQQQLAGLSAQVAELKATNQTLKKYLEAVMTGVDRDEKIELIRNEKQRLQEEALNSNDWVSYISKTCEIPRGEVIEAMKVADGFGEFLRIIYLKSPNKSMLLPAAKTLRASKRAQKDFNEVRTLFGLSPFDEQPGEIGLFMDLFPENKDPIIFNVSGGRASPGAEGGKLMNEGEVNNPPKKDS